jgi:hypothetical protein
MWFDEPHPSPESSPTKLSTSSQPSYKRAIMYTVSAGSAIHADGGSMFFHGIKIHLQVYPVLQPRRK